MRIPKNVPLCVLFLSLTACYPASYEDCILENLEGSKSDRQVTEIRRACRAKFPEEPSSNSAPSASVIESGFGVDFLIRAEDKKLVTGRDARLEGGQLRLLVSNMTEKVLVTQIQFRVETLPAAGGGWPSVGIPNTELHSINVDLPPRSVKTVEIDLGDSERTMTRETPAVWIDEVRGRYV